MEAGLKIAEFFGDKAYFMPQILNRLKGLGTKTYIPVSVSSYKVDDEFYSYNKDSDQWFCKYGNETEKRTTCRTKKRQQVYDSSIF